MKISENGDSGSWTSGWKNIRNFSGVRARTDEEDFILERHGNYIDAAGICSPGLSSAFAIGEYVTELFAQWAEETQMAIVKKESFIDERKKVRFKELNAEEKEALIKKDPAYAHVVCRCETITEGEIRDAFDTPIPPVSLDGVKRRTGTGMGRCQGGFCMPRVADIIAEETGIPLQDVKKGNGDSFILAGSVESFLKGDTTYDRSED